MYQSAIRAALSTKFAQDQLTVVDSLSLPSGAKEDLAARLELLRLQGRKIYFLYGDAQPNRNLIQAADLFERKKKGEKGAPPHGERPLLASWARNVAVSPLLDNELLILDKSAVEVLEEMYRGEK